MRVRNPVGLCYDWKCKTEKKREKYVLEERKEERITTTVFEHSCSYLKAFLQNSQHTQLLNITLYIELDWLLCQLIEDLEDLTNSFLLF